MDELLQHQVVPILLGNFVNDGQVGTGVLQQTGIDLCIAGKTAENVKLPRALCRMDRTLPRGLSLISRTGSNSVSKAFDSQV